MCWPKPEPEQSVVTHLGVAARAYASIDEKGMRLLHRKNKGTPRDVATE